MIAWDAFLISFREFLEAVVIVALVYEAFKAKGVNVISQIKKALVYSFIVSFMFFLLVFFVWKSLEGFLLKLFEGIMSLIVAVAIAFAVVSFVKINFEKSAFIIVFSGVSRELLELFLFLFPSLFQGTVLLTILISLLFSLVLGVVIFFVLDRFLTYNLLKVTSFLLIFIGAGALGYSITELGELIGLESYEVEGMFPIKPFFEIFFGHLDAISLLRVIFQTLYVGVLSYLLLQRF